MATLLSSSAAIFAQQMPSAAPQPPRQADAGKSLSELWKDRLPPWVAFGGEIRLRGEGFTGRGFIPERDDAYLLTRLRLGMNMHPKDWFKFVVEVQDSRILGESQTAPVAPFQDTFRLALANIEMGSLESRKFGVRIGRQDLIFGEQRLVGTANWLNTPNTFDGVHGAIRSDGYSVDVFAACIVKAHPNEFDRCLPGNEIYGLYGQALKPIPLATLEPYFFWRRQSGLTSEAGIAGILHEGTLGVRWVGKLPLGFDYDTEMAEQFGSLDTDAISAQAGHWLLAYTLHTRFTPRFFAEFNYASGDRNPTDGERNTFDQLYPSAHDLYGLADQVGWKNMEQARTGVEVKLKASWAVSSKYSRDWLANSHDALYNTSSAAVARSPTGGAGSYVGQELDFVTSFIPCRQTTFSGGFGHIFPGTFLKITTPGASHSYPYAAVTYDF